MPYVSITPNVPGVRTNGTDYSNKGRYVDSDLVRFHNGNVRPIGGWTKYTGTSLTGQPMSMHAFKDKADNNVLAVGTRSKLYIFYNDTWTDITPTSFVAPTVNSALGYGAYLYGKEDYGDARSSSGLQTKFDRWSLDNWGEQLIACCSSDGRILKWDSNSGGTADTIATAITNAPTGCEGAIVTNERHLVALGASNDPRKIQWSDQEDYTTWTPASTNSAVSLQLRTKGKIVSAERWQTDILLFTSNGLHRMYYQGQPFIYGIQKTAEAVGAMASETIVNTSGFVVWMTDNGFVIYDGTVRPIECDVHDYIFDNIYYNFEAVSCGGHNAEWGEVIWFFPSGTSQTPDKYVIWNYRENHWAVGTTLKRVCWLDRGVFPYGLACDSSGNVYQQERTQLNDSAGVGTAVPYVTTGPMEIGEGDRIAQVNQLLPDEECNNLPALTFEFTGRPNPLGSSTSLGSYQFDSDGYTDARFNAREVTMKIKGVTTENFVVGNIRANIKLRGKR